MIISRAFISSLFVLGFSSSLYAKPLEIRPLLMDRFEGDCGVREQYDFHDNEDRLMRPLSAQIISTQRKDELALNSTTYKLKNVFYAGIPVMKIEFSFGKVAQQYNEFLYLDLRSPEAKAQLAKLSLKHANEDVEIKKNVATIQCYWTLY